MRVLFVVPRFHTNQLEWIRILKKQGHEVAVYAQFQGSTEDYRELKPLIIKPSLISDFRVRIINNSNAEDNIKSLKRMKVFSPSILNLYFQLKKFKPDIVICRDRTKLTAITYFLCKAIKVKCVLYNQTPYYSDPDKSYVKRIISKITFPKLRMTPVLGESKDEKSVMNTFYIPFATSSNEINDRDYLVNGKINILSIGKFYERKNHLMLVSVCEKLLKESFDFHLTIVGENSNITNQKYLNRVEKAIKKSNLEKYITIKTNRSHQEMSEEYIKNDIFVLASTKEQAAVSHLEAMGHGLVSICSESNGTSNYILNGETGYTFKDMDEEDLYYKLKLLCENPEFISQQGNQASNHVKNNYSGDAIYIKFKNLFSNT